MTGIRRVLVIGGGIGGLCAAVALRRQGIAVDLIERNADFSVYGVGIIQPNNTLRALDRIGLAQACVDAGGAFPGWLICDAAGSVTFTAPANTTAAPGYPPINGITRPKLQKILVDAAKASGAVLTLGTKVSDLVDNGDSVDVTFSDGRSDNYDFVVASDGLYSDTRRRLFGEAVRPRFTGEGVWRYNLPRPAEVEWGALYFGPDSKAGIVPMSPTLMYLFLVTPEPDNPDMPPETLAHTMRQRMAAYSGPVAAFREQITDSAGVVYRPMESMMLAAPWHCGRVIVIGDGAHATTPHLAQGAAMAIEDAVLLAELLARDDALKVVLDEFMRRRFDRAKFVVDSSNQLAAWELEEWAGTANPEARPGELLHEASIALMAEY